MLGSSGQLLTTLSIIQAPWDSSKSDGLTKTQLCCPHTPHLPSEAWAGMASQPRAPPQALAPLPSTHLCPGFASFSVLKSLAGILRPRPKGQNWDQGQEVT